jgi:hypothetical protein
MDNARTFSVKNMFGGARCMYGMYEGKYVFRLASNFMFAMTSIFFTFTLTLDFEFSCSQLLVFESLYVLTYIIT